LIERGWLEEKSRALSTFLRLNAMREKLESDATAGTRRNPGNWAHLRPSDSFSFSYSFSFS